MPVRYPGYRSPKEKARMDEFNPKYKPARVDGCRQCRPDSCECEQHRRNKVAGYVDDYGRMQLPGGVEIPPPHTPHIMDGGVSPEPVDKSNAYADFGKQSKWIPKGLGQHGRVMPGGSPVFPSTDDAVRSASPVVTGALDYFPLALLEISRFSEWGNQKHNPGEPLHWARGKSFDHANKVGRHLLERGTPDPSTGGRFSHTVGLAWRALALLQKELELAEGYDRDAK